MPPKYLLLSLILGALSLGGCTSIVLTKARLQPIGRITVVGLHAAERIPEIRGQGVLRALDAQTRQAIAQAALGTFEHAFRQMGWEATPMETLIASPIYREYFAQIAPPQRSGGTHKLYPQRSFWPAEMGPVWFGPEPTRPKGRPLAATQTEALGALLQEQDSDAAVMIFLRYCFRTFREGPLNERAQVTAAAALQILDPRGQRLFESPIPKDCGSGFMSVSEKSMPIQGEDWVFGPHLREEMMELFEQATRAQAMRWAKRLPTTRPESVNTHYGEQTP